MNPRITLLTALAVGAILTTSPAEARRHTAPQRITYGQPIDVAAIPAYPIEANTTPRARSRAASRSRAARSATFGTDDEAKAYGRASPAVQAGSGTVRSRKTGATAHVSPRFAPTVQAIIDDLEQNHGATVKFIGGWRRGSCSLARQHPCGDAADICQLGRGVVDPRCHLPAPAVFHKVARDHGAYEGSTWCSTDYGHIQRRYSGGCSVVAHGRGGRQLATITGKMVEEDSAKVAPEARHRQRRIAHRAYRHRRYARAG